MNIPLYHFFTNDHRRIEKLLDQATENPSEINRESYHRFRIGLLTHIKMEEKILFPAAQKANGGVALPLAEKLRLDHGALTSLMVPPPTPSLLKVLRFILDKHDVAEEKPGGMYDACEALTQSQTQQLLEQLSHTTEVPVHPHHEAPFALEAAKRALARAGYDYDAIAQ
ncbi:MAG: hemerythrin domain-containing protein [Bacteroidetes bacterium]|nr:hemerythrin domain-containing protein [Bacteroidota bacterium]